MKIKFFNFFVFLVLILLLIIGCPEQGSSGSSGGGDSNNSSTKYSAVGLYDTSFNNGGWGADGNIPAIGVQSDGKILIGGNFFTYNLVDVPDNILRLNTDGKYDNTFNNVGLGADNYILVIATQSSGKMLIGGQFTTYNGVNVPDRIIRLNTDGKYDNTFNNGGIGANSDINAIGVQSDGKILIGGSFSTYNGINVPIGIIRLNTDGTYDTTFNSSGSGVNGEVKNIAIQSDGKILIGGYFTTYNGIDVPDYVIRLNINGTHDTTFNNGGSGANGQIDAVTIQGDGKILIGGWFTTYNGLNRPDYIIRLNINGSYDTTFNNGGLGGDNSVSIIAVQSDGKMLIGGQFTTYNGIDVPDRIIRLNTNGIYDTTFNNGGSGANAVVSAVIIQSDGKILIGGWFDTYNGINVPNNIIRLY